MGLIGMVRLTGSRIFAKLRNRGAAIVPTVVVERREEMEMADQYRIRKGIPVPPSTRWLNGDRSKYPFNHMQVEDSFEVPVPNGRSAKSTRAAVYAATKKYTTKTQGAVKFTTRLLDETRIGVWRIK